jgi:hypothetical protein
MVKLKFLVAVAVQSAVAATPALAEHMIDEPGMFAFIIPAAILASDERARSATFKKIPTHRREQNMKQK